ncbi:hypothetical protein [Paenibacillus dendritiformis]|uniref:hypothetical protein n=1 Tax=Paenibacillus dendritiformis TaxID=130049 RepID=UPI000DA9CF4F|nr:hypothetical protein [Paenibacillus dendritiformis]PZM63727.1 hypothetical protein DOE73_20590 [Paenibacillus dendritiformis]
MNIEIYKMMREWERHFWSIEQYKKLIADHEAGKDITPELSDPFNFFDNATSADWAARLLDYIAHSKKEMQFFASELAKKGIDVEYIVTNVYANMKKRGQYIEYHIRREKIEHGGYEYKTFSLHEEPGRERETYNSLEEALTAIHSFYEYLPEHKRESVEDALTRLKKIFD